MMLLQFDEIALEDLGGTAGVGAPGDGQQEQQAAERMVLEHHLSGAAQVDVDETQGGRGRAGLAPGFEN